MQERYLHDLTQGEVAFRRSFELATSDAKAAFTLKRFRIATDRPPVYIKTRENASKDADTKENVFGAPKPHENVLM